MPEPLKLQDIKQRMAGYGLRPHKKFGQNFLADPNLLEAIVRDAGLAADDVVLEVGAGEGVLTNRLAEVLPGQAAFTDEVRVIHLPAELNGRQLNLLMDGERALAYFVDH